MLNARLLVRVKGRALGELESLQLGALWRSVSVYCRWRRALGGSGRRRWTARLGYALMHQDRLDEATAAYAAAITGNPVAASWTEIVRQAQAEVGRDAAVNAQGGRTEPRPSWFYHLGRCLQKQGELDAAAALTEYACQRDPGKSRWLDPLARLHEHVGDLSAAAIARVRLVELRGDEDPAPRHALADLYDKAGHWDQAAEILTANIGQHPGHAPSYELLSRVSMSMHIWGGAFTGMLSDRTGGQFRFAPPAGSAAMRSASYSAAHSAAHSAATAAQGALERAVNLEPANPKWQAALADAHLACGDVAGAVERYQAAVSEAESSNARLALSAKQVWQFRLERSHHMLGHARVSDPLFTAELKPIGKRAAAVERVPGFFHARFIYLGLSIKGFLAASTSEAVDVFLNGRLLRRVNLARGSYLPEFTVTVKRPTLALFPEQGELRVRTADGELLYGPGGADRIEMSVPHGNGQLLDIIGAGGTLDKKGEIRPSPAEMRQRQDRDLEIYAGVRDFFETRLGRSVVLLYGTLLGYHRDGDLIPGDDDFDAGYVSEQTNPKAVKEEAKDIIVELVKAGFTVSFNRRGRLFRVQLGRSAPDGFHVDVHPIWFQDGNVWIHNLLCTPSTREDFVPAVHGKLRGVPVSTPHRPEVFLRGNYGSGWKVPDPGFRYYPSEIDPAVRRNLGQAFISACEYRELANRIDREVAGSPTAGRFVSLGSQNLYPLEEFLT